ncbi:MAG: Membrane protein-like protein [Candidatus Doudnabacteria bacterium]|nr:Membrane protein-like protein [Candidatus Doudnabacteria bacterium]
MANTPEAKSKQTTLFDIIVLAVLMVGVTLLSVFYLLHQSLRLDEAQSLWQTAHTLPVLLKIVAKDVHVPLYHIMLHFWQAFFGNSISGARVFSLIFFVLTIPAIFALGKEAFGRKVGLFAATLTAISPFLNWYGSEARMYSLLVLVTILNQWFFIRIIRAGRKRNYWGYAITALLGIFSHYFFFFALLSQIIFFFINKKSFPENALKYFVRIGAGLFVLFIPWLVLVFRSGLASQTQPLITKPTTYNLFNTINLFFFGFQGSDLTKLLISLWPIIFLFLVLALRKDRRNGERRRIPPVTGYFLLAGVMPMILVFLISFVKPSYLDRYLIFSIPSVFIFFGWIVATYPPKIKNFVSAVLILLMLFSLGKEVTSAATPVKEDYRAAVDYLQQKAGIQDVIIVSAPFTVYPIEYYYHGPTSIQTIPNWNRYDTTGIPAFSEAELPADVDKLKSQYRIAWVILSYDQGYNENIRTYMDQHYQRVDQKSFSQNVNLYAYKLKYN